MVFLPNFHLEDSNQLQHPEFFNVPDSRHHYLARGQEEHLGVWTIPAETRMGETSTCDNRVFCNNHTTIVYLHGQTGHRGLDYRVGLYKALRRFGFNIVTFDYRGFGDSVPSLETTTVARALEDVAAVTSWVLEAGVRNVIIWGHSLGSALAVHFLASPQAPAACGLVLMSPFNNLQDAMYDHKWAAPWRLLIPRTLFYWLFRPRPELSLAPDNLMPDLKVPVLLLHSQDDPVISVELARKLFSARARDSNIQFVELLNNYGHNNLYRAKELRSLMKKMNNHCNLR